MRLFKGELFYEAVSQFKKRHKFFPRDDREPGDWLNDGK